MSSEKKSSPFRRAITSLLLGIASLSLTFPSLFVSHGIGDMAYAAGPLWIAFPIYLVLELPAIVLAVRAIHTGNTTRQHILFLRDERLIVGGLFLSYLTLTIAGMMILGLPLIGALEHLFRRGPLPGTSH